MPIWILEHRITIKLDAAEARALRTALGALPRNAWETAGVSPDGIAVVNELYTALETELSPSLREGTER